MFQTFFVHILLAVLSITAYIVSAKPALPSNDGLVFLGTVDQVQYYVETAPERNWTDAKHMCEEAGMRLARVTDGDENRFLKGVTDPVTFPSDYYWTAGTDAFSIQRFAWDPEIFTPIQYQVSGLSMSNGIDRNYACLSYRNDEILNQLYAFLCADLLPTLCEISGRVNRTEYYNEHINSK